MSVKILEKVSINNSDQWILVKGKDLNSPLILEVQAGPGLPMISEANMLEELHHFENDFLVAYWDQRGCGKSFDKNEDSRNININQLSDDLISCTKYLLKRFKKDQAILIGYSIGATLSLFAAQKAPSLFSKIIAVGTDIDLPVANSYAMEFLLDKSKNHPGKKFARQVNQLQGVELNTAKLLQKRTKLLGNHGGIMFTKSYNDIFITTLKNMLFTKEYRFSDIIKSTRGIDFSLDSLLPEMNQLNLFDKIKSLEVPVHFMQGKKDAVAPFETGLIYFEFLDCESKSFTEFKNSAHFPHLEEPEKFAGLVREKILAYQN